MGKYCSEGRRKRAMIKAAYAKKLACGQVDKTETNRPKKLDMKTLVRICHVKEPAKTVMCILGKKYPGSMTSFLESPLAATEEFDPARRGKRMKIPTPVTWET